MASGNSKKKRNKPCKPPGVSSKGTGRGARKAHLSESDKAMLGKGVFDRIAHQRALEERAFKTRKKDE
jgi:hypothetical protein